MDCFNNIDDCSGLEGQISELFSAPVIPKIIIVGLSEGEIGGSEELRVFREILQRALNNLFVVEFLEQFVPSLPKLPNTQIHYRNHQVKESWMFKIRHELPALLIDFRLLSIYSTGLADDAVLIEQILQTKSSLPLDGPVYLVWLAGREISAQRISAILKATRMEKSTISSIELSSDPARITSALKMRIQDCFEQSRLFFQNLSRKYKKLMSKSDQAQKFLQPWMLSVYYYFKLAVLEEFRGDFQSALKYYHTILAKYKELIEDTKDNFEQQYQIINYLRKSADICFIRLSFLLFRLDQSGEAEFGLFRYLNYFSHGLGLCEQHLWRYNMSRGFARQLSKSVIWSTTNGSLMRGPAHFFIYRLQQAEKYLKCSSGEDVYQIQEMIMRDLSEALESALQNTSLNYFVDYLQILILKQYLQFQDDSSRAFLNYLKNSLKIQGWKMIHCDILKKSAHQAKNEQDYKTAVMDEWASHNFVDFSLFEDWCLMYAQIYQEPIRLNFPVNENNLIFCNVRFCKRKCEIFEPVEVELNVLVCNDLINDSTNNHKIIIESIGVFFDNDQIEPITFTCNDTENYKADQIFTFRSQFILNKICKVGKLKISFVTMQLKRPFLALQFDDSCFAHQQNCPTVNIFYRNMNFVRLCQGTLKSDLSLKIEPLKPKIRAEFQFKDSYVLMESELAVLLNLKNETEHATITHFIFSGKDYNLNLGPYESQSIGLKYKVPSKPNYIFFKANTKFNLELMDFKFTEICNFESVETEFKSEKLIDPINPFRIALSKGFVDISAYYDIELLHLQSSEDVPCIIKANEVRRIKVEEDNPTTIKGSFRLLDDSSKEIYQHEWEIK